ncbi:hypothetical protein [Armatimonas sp.]|uniref:hypothetical protein n=1 Tax=Armatimonas sp. TaxID=1872638 RepID=UPI003752961E
MSTITLELPDNIAAQLTTPEGMAIARAAIIAEFAHDVNDAEMETKGPSYHCYICKGSVPHFGPHEHELDPCALVIIGHADKEWRDQKEQTFYCHFECFRRLVGDDSILYIKDDDHSTNGEFADEYAAEKLSEEEVES